MPYNHYGQLRPDQSHSFPGGLELKDEGAGAGAEAWRELVGMGVGVNPTEKLGTRSSWD